MVRPASPSFQLLRYWDPQADLAHTDLDLLEGRGAQPLQCQRLDMQGLPLSPHAKIAVLCIWIRTACRLAAVSDVVPYCPAAMAVKARC